MLFENNRTVVAFKPCTLHLHDSKYKYNSYMFPKNQYYAIPAA